MNETIRMDLWNFSGQAIGQADIPVKDRPEIISFGSRLFKFNDAYSAYCQISKPYEVGMLWEKPTRP